MAMKKKNSLPDMYSPEKKFYWGFFAYMACWSRKQKKELAKSAFKKRARKSRYLFSVLSLTTSFVSLCEAW